MGSLFEGNYSVDMTDYIFHVGKTGVKYTTICGFKTCLTTFTGFVSKNSDGSFGTDGFWDIFWGEDKVGADGELVGTPYPYKTYRWEVEWP